MADTEDLKEQTSMDEMQALVHRLDSGGIINLDVPVRKILEATREFNAPVAEKWYFLVGSGGFCIIKSKT